MELVHIEEEYLTNSNVRINAFFLPAESMRLQFMLIVDLQFSDFFNESERMAWIKGATQSV